MNALYLYSKTEVFKGYKVTVSIHQDIHHDGAPWEESDGHGIVSGWERRDKRPGERVLNSDRSLNRFYDVAETMKLAKRDGWGLSDEAKSALAVKLGRTPTAGDILAEAVNGDFEYLRGWCNDEWQWLGYTTEIETPEGETIDGDSCWGFEGTTEGEKYMIGEAMSQARSMIERDMLTKEQTQIAACMP